MLTSSKNSDSLIETRRVALASYLSNHILDDDEYDQVELEQHIGSEVDLATTALWLTVLHYAQSCNNATRLFDTAFNAFNKATDCIQSEAVSIFCSDSNTDILCAAVQNHQIQNIEKLLGSNTIPNSEYSISIATGIAALGNFRLLHKYVEHSSGPNNPIWLGLSKRNYALVLSGAMRHEGTDNKVSCILDALDSKLVSHDLQHYSNEYFYKLICGPYLTAHCKARVFVKSVEHEETEGSSSQGWENSQIWMPLLKRKSTPRNLFEGQFVYLSTNLHMGYILALGKLGYSTGLALILFIEQNSPYVAVETDALLLKSDAISNSEMLAAFKAALTIRLSQICSRILDIMLERGGDAIFPLANLFFSTNHYDRSCTELALQFLEKCSLPYNHNQNIPLVWSIRNRNHVVFNAITTPKNMIDIDLYAATPLVSISLPSLSLMETRLALVGSCSTLPIIECIAVEDLEMLSKLFSYKKKGFELNVKTYLEMSTYCSDERVFLAVIKHCSISQVEEMIVKMISKNGWRNAIFAVLDRLETAQLIQDSNVDLDKNWWTSIVNMVSYGKHRSPTLHMSYRECCKLALQWATYGNHRSLVESLLGTQKFTVKEIAKCAGLLMEEETSAIAQYYYFIEIIRKRYLVDSRSSAAAYLIKIIEEQSEGAAFLLDYIKKVKTHILDFGQIGTGSETVHKREIEQQADRVYQHLGTLGQAHYTVAQIHELIRIFVNNRAKEHLEKIEKRSKAQNEALSLLTEHSGQKPLGNIDYPTVDRIHSGLRSTEDITEIAWRAVHVKESGSLYHSTDLFQEGLPVAEMMYRVYSYILSVQDPSLKEQLFNKFEIQLSEIRRGRNRSALEVDYDAADPEESLSEVLGETKSWKSQDRVACPRGGFNQFAQVLQIDPLFVHNFKLDDTALIEKTIQEQANILFRRILESGWEPSEPTALSKKSALHLFESVAGLGIHNTDAVREHRPEIDLISDCLFTDKHAETRSMFIRLLGTTNFLLDAVNKKLEENGYHPVDTSDPKMSIIIQYASFNLGDPSLVVMLTKTYDDRYGGKESMIPSKRRNPFVLSYEMRKKLSANMIGSHLKKGQVYSEFMKINPGSRKRRHDSEDEQRILSAISAAVAEAPFDETPEHIAKQLKL